MDIADTVPRKFIVYEISFIARKQTSYQLTTEFILRILLRQKHRLPVHLALHTHFQHSYLLFLTQLRAYQILPAGLLLLEDGRNLHYSQGVPL